LKILISEGIYIEKENGFIVRERQYLPLPWAEIAYWIFSYPVNEVNAIYAPFVSSRESKGPRNKGDLTSVRNPFLQQLVAAFYAT